MTNTSRPYSPSPEYRYFLYDPNDGHTFYRTPEERDIAAKSLIEDYLVDGEWSEQVVDIYAGEATHSVSEVERIDKVGELDEDGYDENGEYWVDDDVDYKCNYDLRPLVPTPPAKGEDLATSLQNCGTWLIEIGYASEQVNARDMGIKVARAAALLQQQAAELAMLRQLARPVAIPGEAYEIDMGDVMWWRFPIDEPPWLGTPGDSDWPGYHTHFTPCPAEPVLPLPSGEASND